MKINLHLFYFSIWNIKTLALRVTITLNNNKHHATDFMSSLFYRLLLVACSGTTNRQSSKINRNYCTDHLVIRNIVSGPKKVWCLFSSHKQYERHPLPLAYWTASSRRTKKDALAKWRTLILKMWKQISRSHQTSERILNFHFLFPIWEPIKNVKRNARRSRRTQATWPFGELTFRARLRVAHRAVQSSLALEPAAPQPERTEQAAYLKMRDYAIWNLNNRPHRAKRKRRQLAAEVGSSAIDDTSYNDISGINDVTNTINITTNMVINTDRSECTRPTSPADGRQSYSSNGCQTNRRFGCDSRGAPSRASAQSSNSSRISAMKARRRTGCESKLRNAKIYNRLKSELCNKENGRPADRLRRREKKSKWALIRWSTIFLFVIQLAYIAPAKAEERSAVAAATTKGSTKDLIRSTIDRRHSTYSTYFGDLYTTPIYSRLYSRSHTAATNSLGSRRTTGAPQEQRSHKNRDYDERPNNGRRQNAVNALNKPGSRSTSRSTNRSTSKSDGRRPDGEPTKSAESNDGCLPNCNFRGNTRARRTTTSRAASPSTTTKAFAKQIESSSNFLTANKQIQSIKYDSQYPWIQQRPPIYKSDIDFEFAHHGPAKKKRRNVTEPAARSDEPSNDGDRQRTSEEPVAIKDAHYSFKPNQTTLSSSAEYVSNYDFRTTDAFKPFSSQARFTRNENHFDYSSSYDGDRTRFQSSQATTKLPRIKKNSKNVQPNAEAIPPVRLPTNQSFEFDEQQPLDQTLSDDERNRTITRFLNEMINSTGLDDKFYDLNDLNETYLNELLNNQTLDSPFLLWVGQYIAHPSFEKLFVTLAQIICLIFTIIGNVLVIISIFTYNPLRNVQNMFLASLAVSDIMVAVCILPLNVAYYLIGEYFLVLLFVLIFKSIAIDYSQAMLVVHLYRWS